MIISLDLHTHSDASFDSLLSVRKIPKILKYRGLDGYALTDHDTVKNLEEAEFYAKKNGLLFVPGIEKKTDKGDILGLFINMDIISYEFEDVIREIKDQGGISVLPHPFKSHEKIILKDWKIFNAIEVVNGRCSDELNTRCLIEAEGMAHLGGSDAHTFWELGSVCTQLFVENNYPITKESIKKAIIEKRTLPYRKRKFNYQRYLWTVRYSSTIKAAKEGHLCDYIISLASKIFFKK